MRHASPSRSLVTCESCPAQRQVPSQAAVSVASGATLWKRRATWPISPSIALVSEQWAGALAYPDDVATSYSFKTTGGTVVVRTSLLRGAAALSSSLQCSDSSVLSTSHADQITMKAPPGSCTYNLQFIETAFVGGARAVYKITAQYPAAVPAS